jgi:hypothetical protein
LQTGIHVGKHVAINNPIPGLKLKNIPPNLLVNRNCNQNDKVRLYIQIYLNGAAIGSTTLPVLTMTLGIVAFWNVDFVVHSGPMGSLRLRSYWAFVSKG